MYNWLVVIPPLVVLICALATGRMILSFFAGIVTGAFIATYGNLLATALLILKRLQENAGLTKIFSWQELINNWNLSVFIFLICIGILIVLLQNTGSAHTFTQLAQKKVKTKKSVQITSLLLSWFFFIDDYFSSLTVGSIMRPLANIHQLHPVKLAFLVVAMASPISLLSPISSWVGEIVLQLKQSGVSTNDHSLINADPFAIFLKSIPFILYAILIIAGVWYIVLRGISYGPMHYYDTLKSSAPTNVIELPKPSKNAMLLDFILPILLVVIFVFATLLITGGFTFTGNITFFQALKEGSVQQAFLISGTSSVLISFIYFIAQNKMKASSIGQVIRQGVDLMLPSIFMLISAWTLSTILKRDLQTGAYIANLFSSIVNIAYFPVICFVSTTVIAAMVGSAWAAMGIMLPIVIPMLTTLAKLPPHATAVDLSLLLPVIGATLSGCVTGAQLSIISDNPIMAAASTGANHLKLMKAMSWYIIPIGIATALGYTAMGLLIKSQGMTNTLLISLFVAAATMIVLFEIAQFIASKSRS
jgi:tetracycline resistance efflux pump